jgi:hypothetical protein
VKLSTIGGVRPKHRLDRPSRQKFADGGTAYDESDQSTQTTASPGDTPRSGVDALMANPKVRGIGAALTAIDKANQVLSRWGSELTGSKPAHRRDDRPVETTDLTAWVSG